MNNTSDAIDFLKKKRLVFTITSGRSGTTLLTKLLHLCLGIDAEHEPTPRLNYVLRAVMAESKAARWWLLTEKLPHIAATMKGNIYIETSHLYCKGFIEHLLALGLHPAFIILTRPASEVAQSLFQISCIPERTGAGRLSLIGPSDPGVLRADGWQHFSDYQLCYWYALEIERRQQHYETTLPSMGCQIYRTEMKALTNLSAFRDLADFVVDTPFWALDTAEFRVVTTTNQNPTTSFSQSGLLRVVPENWAEQEQRVRHVVSDQVTAARAD